MAHWIIYERQNGNMNNMYKCSACGYYFVEYDGVYKLDACPGCGAPMDEPHEMIGPKQHEEMIKMSKECQKFVRGYLNEEETAANSSLKYKMERLKYEKSAPGIFERYMRDVLSYLSEKFPDLPADKVMDAASYISNRAGIMCNDLMWERDREWRGAIKKLESQLARERKINERRKRWGEENENRS